MLQGRREVGINVQSSRGEDGSLGIRDSDDLVAVRCKQARDVLPGIAEALSAVVSGWERMPPFVGPRVSS